MKETKLIALYYPQFHTIKENDEAWGKDFTDWVRVRESKPLFEGHYQPRVPQDKNYYDLSNPEVLTSQVELAKKYNIDGFCFYHYWFDGKLLLEKPLEIFLNNKSLDISFCVSWANETWTKRWTGEANVIIQKQTHKPDKEIWKKHFDYLLPLFRDKRYIRINDKPVLLIYQSQIINEIDKLFDFWQELAQSSGLRGIYFIDTKRQKFISKSTKKVFDGILKFQPQEAYNSNNFGERSFMSRLITNSSFFFPEIIKNTFSIFKDKTKVRINKFDSNKVWKSIIDNSYKENSNFKGKIYESAFVNWDNSPRYGIKANIYSHIKPDDFEKYISEMIIKANETNSEYLFINAWNEWAEGAYLESDEIYEEKYLQALQNARAKYDIQ